MTDPIDLWNLESYDPELRAALAANHDVIISYWDNRRRMDAELEADPDNFVLRQRTNPVDDQYRPFLEQTLTNLMRKRRVIAYHYTRLTDDEVLYIRMHGIEVSTLTSLRRRLSARVEAGDIDSETADKIYAGSPLHKESTGRRANFFWTVTPPDPVDHLGLRDLLGYWGGEVVHKWMADGDRGALTFGKRRVFVIAMPLTASSMAFSAAGAAVTTYLRFHGRDGESSGFDLKAVDALAPEAILAVYTEDEPEFETVGR